MKSYLINLDRREDRLKDITEIFNHNNIDFIRVSAVDGKKYSTSVRDWKHPITPPEVGCFYSHIKCYELIVASDDEYGVIFEDDIILSESAELYLSHHNWIPENADIVKIETKSGDKKVKISNTQPCGDVAIGRLHSTHLGTAGYIISKRAAQLILDRISSPIMPIDNYLFMPGHGPLADLIVYQLTPAICKQKALESTIDAERSEWHALEVEERRRNKVPTGLGSRIIREIKRPLKRSKPKLIEQFERIQNSVRVGRSWKRIPFD